GRDAVLAPDGGRHQHDLLHLCVREHGHGLGHAACGRRTAAFPQLWRHGSRHPVDRHRHPDVHPPQSHAGSEVIMYKYLALASVALLLAACGSKPPRPVEEQPGVSSDSATPARPASKRGGGYYLDDGPGDDEPAPEVLAATPDAVPRAEPLHRFANRPYTVLGKNYTPMKTRDSYRTTGIASWYGKKFHGQKTSSGEVYDMYAMTAAHPTLPIPSYARVTNPANGRSVVVRVNDRGPFLHNRIEIGRASCRERV